MSSPPVPNRTCRGLFLPNGLDRILVVFWRCKLRRCLLIHRLWWKTIAQVRGLWSWSFLGVDRSRSRYLPGLERRTRHLPRCKVAGVLGSTLRHVRHCGPSTDKRASTGRPAHSRHGFTELCVKHEIYEYSMSYLYASLVGPNGNGQPLRQSKHRAVLLHDCMPQIHNHAL